MTRVTSRSELLFQSVRVRLRFASTHIIRFSSGWFFAISKNTVRIRLRFDKNSVKPVYKTSVRVLFDFLTKTKLELFKSAGYPLYVSNALLYLFKIRKQ